jgi:diaminopimelate epimerase
MIKKTEIIVANPAGNITIFVKSKTKRSDYQKVAKALLGQTDYRAEQVAFILEDGRIEMSGMEFCGNATRSYGLILSADNKGHALANNSYMNMVSISGTKEPLKTISNPSTGFSKVEMPLPISIKNYTLEDSTLVDFEGIVHLVLNTNKYPLSSFDKIKDEFYKSNNPPAFGIMYYDKTKSFMTPIVYVRDVNTTFHEGSCGSGTVALTASLTKEFVSGEYRFEIKQPDGIIASSVTKNNNKISTITIEGIVEIIDKNIVDINLEEDL